MKKIIFLLLIIGALAGAGTAWYLWNKPHEDLGKASADFTLSAQELMQAFTDDETAANAKYLNKVIQVSGTVAEVRTADGGEPAVLLDTGNPMSMVICQLDPRNPTAAEGLETGQEASFKGQCTGILSDVVLVNCVKIP